MICVQEHGLTKVLDEQLRQAREVVAHCQQQLRAAQYLNLCKAMSFNAWNLGMAVDNLYALEAKRLQLEAEAGTVRIKFPSKFPELYCSCVMRGKCPRSGGGWVGGWHPLPAEQQGPPGTEHGDTHNLTGPV
jgi:hypothetical protein